MIGKNQLHLCSAVWIPLISIAAFVLVAFVGWKVGIFQ